MNFLLLRAQKLRIWPAPGRKIYFLSKYQMITPARDMRKKIIAMIIVAIKRIFSKPLFVRKTSLLPPNIPDKPAPRCCKRITTISNMAVII